MKNYTKMLNEHGLKATPQRLVILEIIEKGGHINIDNLYKKVKEKFDSISLATIYKNINAMLEKKVLAEVKLANRKNVYEIEKHSHGHLLCNKCDEVTDIDIKTKTIEETLSKKFNFDIEKTDIVLNGVCHNCKDL